MRRIIERVVTVVTTTTWKISWQDDSIQSTLQPDPFTDNIPTSGVSGETAKHIQKFSYVTTTKEADPAEMKTDPTADEPPLDPDSNQSKIERK